MHSFPLSCCAHLNVHWTQLTYRHRTLSWCLFSVWKDISQNTECATWLFYRLTKCLVLTWPFPGSTLQNRSFLLILSLYQFWFCSLLSSLKLIPVITHLLQPEATLMMIASHIQCRNGHGQRFCRVSSSNLRMLVPSGILYILFKSTYTENK